MAPYFLSLLSILFSIFYSAIALCNPNPNLKRDMQRIQNQLIIEDIDSAFNGAKQLKETFPNLKECNEIYIKTVVQTKNEKEMVRAWNDYQKKFCLNEKDHELLEEIAWGFIANAASSSTLTTRLYSLLAAYFCQDSKGVGLLLKRMDDPNTVIRTVSCELAGHFHDQILKDKIASKLFSEKEWIVRQAVIKSAGAMKIYELAPQLKKIISSSQSNLEEKKHAIVSLVNLWKNPPTTEELTLLASNNHVEMRLLACHIIAHFGGEGYEEISQILLDDPSPMVRASAFQMIGLAFSKENKNNIQFFQAAKRHLSDTDPYVKIASAWWLTLQHDQSGISQLSHFLDDPDQNIRLAAAAAVANSGLGIHFFLDDHLSKNRDPFVRLNLAIGAIGIRQHIDRSAEIIQQFIENESSRWSEKENGFFTYYCPSCLQNSRKLENSEIEHQTIRLQLLHLLMIVNAKNAQDAIAHSIKNPSWGIPSMASALLLMEGDENAVELVLGLLNDPQQKIRLQAAILLSLWSHDEKMISILEEAYSSADHGTKLHILESIARIGSKKSLPILIQALEEPSQQLRIVAATAIIHCINS